MALFNGMMISHQELGRPMSHSHGSAGPWIDSTFEAKDVNLAYRLPSRRYQDIEIWGILASAGPHGFFCQKKMLFRSTFQKNPGQAQTPRDILLCAGVYQGACFQDLLANQQ